jgi:RNA polymerase sigma-70 factor (sigma-E family)
MGEPDYTTYVHARLPELRRAGYLLCGDWDRGDDVVQRTLTELYVQWSRASRADNLDAYVRTMLYRRFLDERRRPWWTRVHLSDSPPDTAAPPDPEPGLDIDLRAALMRVPPRQRAVLVLRFFHDQSVEQTAETLRCGTGTVKSQTARGLARLRQLLGDGSGDRKSYPVGSTT